MRKIFPKPAFITFLLVFTMKLQAQQPDTQGKVKRNIIGTYAGVFELNLHYERNLIYKPIAQTNIRFGIGHGAFMMAGEGTYINPTVVQLIGKRNSHLEMDLGAIIMLNNSIQEPDFSDTFILNAYTGYRYEKVNGGFIIRAGISYPTILNAGIGYKF
jgi:hypothetical protein